MEDAKESNMDNSSVVAPSSPSQGQHNTESDSPKMELSDHSSGQLGDRPSNDNTGAVGTSEFGVSSPAAEVKPASTQPTADTKTETPEASSPSNPHPDDDHSPRPDSKGEQNTDSPPQKSSSIETDSSDSSFVVVGKNSCEAAYNDQPGALKEETDKDSINTQASTSEGNSTQSSDQNKLEDVAETTQSTSAEAAVIPTAPLAQAEPSTPSEETCKRKTDPSQKTTAGASSSSESSGAVGGKSSGPSQGESVYYVKWILFNNTKVPIITQNENGPCPLLAIMNVLLLKGKVRLAPLVEMITSEQLMAHLGDCVVESKPKNLDETHRANYEQNMQDAMNLMYKLQTGLDVNVKFTGVSDFEYTSECIIFDLLELGLYHGWLVDPQDGDNVRAVGKCSYNQLVEKVIQDKHSSSDQRVHEALIAEQFLDRTASQLTYHGLCELSSTVKEKELCVFFRNNHFNTLYRHSNELFLLVTDQGFLTESSVVWETLSNVDGDCHFVDANFCTYTKPQPSSQPIAASPYFSGNEQISSDYQVALSLQHHDQQMIAEQEAAWGQFHNDFGTAQTSDHELALRLQEEEDRRAAAAMQEQRNQQGQGQAGAGQAQTQGHAEASGGGERRTVREREERREKKDSKDCCIL